jgi:hypothetical protein
MMAWLKIQHETPEKPEILLLGKILNISQGDAFLACFRFWRWADLNVYGCNAPSVTLALLDSVVGIKNFGEAMVSVGWISQDETGLRIPNFERHNSQSAKKRALTSNRVSQHRAKKCNANVTLGALQKRYQSKSKNKNIIPPFPPSLKTPEFQQAWEDWIRFRQEKKKPLTPTCVKEQFSFLENLGPVKGIESIRNSIRNGWQGLFEPDPKNPKEKPTERDAAYVERRRRETQQVNRLFGEDSNG